jgi:pilus assembly protein CpaB
MGPDMLFRNVLIIFGVVFILIGSVLMLNMFRQDTFSNSRTVQSSAVEAPVVTEYEALKTAHSLKSGTLLRDSDIVWKRVSQSEIRPGAILRGQANSKDIFGAITRRDFTEGEMLLTADLVMPNDRQFLAAVLHPGNRAVSISVDAPQSSSGLVLPGDFVDVILTQNLGKNVADLSRRSVAETVLRNVRVIAVDRQLSKPARAKASIEVVPDPGNVPKTVTLELNEQEAEKLFVATQLGSLQLSVRPLASLNGNQDNASPRSPTWASDVSPALREFAGKPVLTPSSPATGIESLIRRPPAVYQ